MTDTTIGRATAVRCAVVLVALTAIVSIAVPAGAKPRADVIVLPGAHSAEGIAAGPGSTFYAGDLFGGDIYRGDLQKGTAEKFIDNPDGRMAAGMKFDADSGLLFVAGLFTGQGYVYNTSTGATVAVYQFADPSSNPIINDVTLTDAGAWFTNSSAPVLYFVPLTNRVPGPFTSLTVSGPDAHLSGQFNNNGIDATPDGSTLILAHSGDGVLYTVDPSTGSSALISGVSVPNVDGIIMRGHRIWAVQNLDNQISEIRLSPDLSSGAITDVITSSHFEIPTTAMLHGNELGVINAKFDTGFPPNAHQYEVVIVQS